MLNRIMKFYFPTLKENRFLFKLISKSIDKLLFLTKFNNFIKSIQHKKDDTFLNIFIKKLNKRYEIVNIRNIPPKNRLIIIANHPTGIIDPLILLLIVKKSAQMLKQSLMKIYIIFFIQCKTYFYRLIYTIQIKEKNKLKK